MPDRRPFQKPRILTDSEANTIRGKCLVAAASPQELMELIGHFDLVIDKLRGDLAKASRTGKSLTQEGANASDSEDSIWDNCGYT